MTDFEKCEINVTVGNGQKMKCELKSSVNMNPQDGQTVKLTEVLYVPQAMKNILSILQIVSKGAMMRATQDKMFIKENGVSMILDSRKGQNKSMMVYLKEKRYPP